MGAPGSCRKRRYSTERDARDWLAIVQNEMHGRTWRPLKGKKHGPIAVYWCWRCDGWHLTSRARKRGARKAGPKRVRKTA